MASLGKQSLKLGCDEYMRCKRTMCSHAVQILPLKQDVVACASLDAIKGLHHATESV